MRGGFDKECAFIFGPRSPFGVPGTVRLSPVPCRKVEQVEISQMQFPYTLANHWVTFDLLVPNVPLTYTPFIGITYEDWCQADVVVFLDDVDVGYLALRAEEIVPDEGGPYWRALLVPLAALEVPPWPPLAPLPPLPPLPPPPPPATYFGCAQCPGGSYNVWRISIAGGTGDFAVFNGDYDLVASGCIWGYYGGGLSIELQQQSAPRTYVSCSAMSGAQMSFNLEGENVCVEPLELPLSFQLGSGTPPSTVTLVYVS